jgi:2-haloacid dehalogenase
MYSEFEPREQAKAYRSYRDVLSSVTRDFARELRFEVNQEEASGLADSIRDWQPFSDTIPALRILKREFKLAILSNIDDDLFAYSAKKLDLPLDCVVTAQQAQSYKPSLNNFELLLTRLSIPRSRLLHVAESLFHDVAPANSLGIKAVWVNRRQGKAAAASKLVDARPDLEVRNLTELASHLERTR